MKFDKKVLSEEELSKVNGGVLFNGTDYDANALIEFWNTYKNNLVVLNMAKPTLKAIKSDIYKQFENDVVDMPPDMDEFLQKL